MTTINQQHIEPSGFVRLDHAFGIFLDPEKYAPIANLTDESSALLKLGLIAENFLSVYITNIRQPGSEHYVRDTRYFMPKLETCVALGLPIVVADALKFINNMRNKLAHDLDYELTQSDYAELEIKVNAISASDVNFNNYFNEQSIDRVFTHGVDSLMFIRDAPYAMTNKQRRISRLVGTVFILSNKCAFFTINQLAHQGRLSLSQPS